MADVTSGVLAQFVRGVTGWDDDELERAIGRVQGERGWRFQVGSDEACRLMAVVAAGRRSSAWHWLWEETTASWSELADEVEAA